MGNIKSFIHGNAVVAEHAGHEVFVNIEGVPATDTLGLPHVWGESYRGRAGITNWFHLAIPTLPVISSSLVQLEDVFIFFRTVGLCQIEEIQFWDGPVHINRISSLAISGDFLLDPIPGKNAFNVREGTTGVAHTMKYGLNIGIGVHFIDESDILFFSAGASFITSD